MYTRHHRQLPWALRHAYTEAVFEERAKTRSINVYGFWVLDLNNILNSVLERCLYKKYTKRASLNEIRVFHLGNTIKGTFERNLRL